MQALSLSGSHLEHFPARPQLVYPRKRVTGSPYPLASKRLPMPSTDNAVCKKYNRYDSDWHFGKNSRIFHIRSYCKKRAPSFSVQGTTTRGVRSRSSAVTTAGHGHALNHGGHGASSIIPFHLTLHYQSSTLLFISLGLLGNHSSHYHFIITTCVAVHTCSYCHSILPRVHNKI